MTERRREEKRKQESLTVRTLCSKIKNSKITETNVRGEKKIILKIKERELLRHFTIPINYYQIYLSSTNTSMNWKVKTQIKSTKQKGNPILFYFIFLLSFYLPWFQNLLDEAQAGVRSGSCSAIRIHVADNKNPNPKPKKKKKKNKKYICRKREWGEDLKALLYQLIAEKKCKVSTPSFFFFFLF